MRSTRQKAAFLLAAALAGGGCGDDGGGGGGGGGSDAGGPIEIDAAPPSLEGNYRAQADGAMVTLDLMYLDEVGLFGFAWWNSANAIEATIDHARHTGRDDYLYIVANSFDIHATDSPINPSPNFINEYYDDEGWWALTWLKAYDLTGEARYLEMAETIFDDIAGGWDDVCGGGVWWSKERSYKNAITNELFLTLAARLHQRTTVDGEPTDYLDWANREWQWFAASQMINGESLVNDGLDADCLNNGETTWTYNQGVILGGLAEMSEITGDQAYLDQAVAIADAAIARLVTDRGVLTETCEPGCDATGAQFKGIFMRNLSALYEAAPEPQYAAFITLNADSIHERATSDLHEIGLMWDAPFDQATPERQSSGLDAINAAIRFTAAPRD